MADTFTTNLGVRKADPTDVIENVSQINAAFDIYDTFMGAVKCSSITRPTTTYGGQLIYETDTGRLAENTGTKASPVWTYVSSVVLTYTSTTRPALGLVSGLLIYESDTDALVRYTGSAWKYATTVVCTSATRPTTGIAQGSQIYESDTLAYAEYSGSAWRYTSIVTCTSSTRPTTALAAGVQAYETDTHRQIVYTGAAWQQVNQVVCTSSTHPANPLTGGEIFETDTGMNAAYNGTAYLYTAQQAAPTLVLGTTTASVAFTGLPAVTRLLMCWRARGSVSGGQMLNMQIDGVTSSSYQWVRMASASGVASATHSGAAVAQIQIGIIDAATANYFASGYQIIDGWNSATGFTTSTGTYCNLSTTTADDAGSIGGQMNVVGPHTSIKIFPAANSLAAGSQFTPYALM